MSAETNRPAPRIVCAANRNQKGKILLGVRHWDKFMTDHKVWVDAFAPRNAYKWEQGFIDQFGDFYTARRRGRLRKLTVKSSGITMFARGDFSLSICTEAFMDNVKAFPRQDKAQWQKRPDGKVEPPEGWLVYSCECGSEDVFIAKPDHEWQPNTYCRGCGRQKTDWFQ